MAALCLVLINGSSVVSATTNNNPNLISNNDLESNTVNPANPDTWTTNSWGTNTATFAYLNSGHSGNHSVQTTVSNYQNGDAKWRFDSVPVQSGMSYSYSDWYEASSTTSVWAQYYLSNGTYQYSWLTNDQPSSVWVQNNLNLSTPNLAVSVSIFHVVNTNGSLILDDVYLGLSPECNISNVNGVYNGGFEQTCPSNPSQPADWSPTTSGNPNATFGLTSASHSGSNAVQTSMLNNSGEAGWQSTWQPSLSNQRYNLKFWHNGTTYVYAYVVVQLNDGSIQYLSLMSVPATLNTGWSQYSDNFVTPINTSKVQVIVATSGAGTFTLDDVSLGALTNQNPATFTNGIISLTFDDGDSSTYTNGSPILKSLGLKGTFYLNGANIGLKGYMTTSQVRSLYLGGQEIGSHQYDHINQVNLTPTQLNNELIQNNNYLHSILGSQSLINDFACPYGAYTSTSVNTDMNYYQSNRITDNQFNSKANFNTRQIHAVLVYANTTVNQVKSWIQTAQNNNEWLVLVYHSIGSAPSGGDGQGYATSPTNFNLEMNYLKQTNISVLPVSSALNQILPQEN